MSMNEEVQAVLARIQRGDLETEACELEESLRTSNEAVHELARQIELLEEQFAPKIKAVRDAVKAYNKARLRLLKKRMEEEDLVFCTWCKTLLAGTETQEVFISGARQRSKLDHYVVHSWEEDFSEIHVMCASCLQREREKRRGSPRNGEVFAVEEHARGFVKKADLSVEVGGARDCRHNFGLNAQKLFNRFCIPPKAKVWSQHDGEWVLEFNSSNARAFGRFGLG